jgi:hypothetical protein
LQAAVASPQAQVLPFEAVTAGIHTVPGYALPLAHLSLGPTGPLLKREPAAAA